MNPLKRYVESENQLVVYTLIRGAWNKAPSDGSFQVQACPQMGCVPMSLLGSPNLKILTLRKSPSDF